MKVLVTGGAGFIGSNFVKMALGSEFPEITGVIVLDKLTYAGSKSNLGNLLDDSRVEFQIGDICDHSLVENVVSRVDAIINFAAESHVDRSIENSTEFIRTNVLGTQILLEAAKKHGVSKFLQVSTDEVYGSILEGSWDENSPLLPNSPYAASKASADLVVRSYFVTHGLNVNISRCSNNFGPNQHQEKLIPNFVLKLNRKEKIPVYGDGMNVREWLYVEEHCRGLYLILTRGKPGEIYNIGGGVELTNMELTRKILRLLGATEDSIDWVSDRPGHDRRYSINCDKIKLLGYAPNSNLDADLRMTIEDYLHVANKKIASSISGTK
jgi:dTDP-glucose 4,6-dehydratase